MRHQCDEGGLVWELEYIVSLHVWLRFSLTSSKYSTRFFRATVLYDRPSPAFKPIPVIEKHELFKKLAEEYPIFASIDSNIDSAVAESTVFTQKLRNGDVVLKPNRPALLISSTSWTPDEDFGILLRALESKIPLQNFSAHFRLTIFHLQDTIRLRAVHRIIRNLCASSREKARKRTTTSSWFRRKFGRKSPFWRHGWKVRIIQSC